MKYGVADYTVNINYTDITTGDLFTFYDYKTSQKHAGMIISQECNNIIRINNYSLPPERVNKSFIFLIYDMIEISNDTIGETILKDIHNCLWPIDIDGKMYLLRSTHKSMSLDLSIVDLCSLNKSGEAIIHWEKNAIKHKNIHSTKYFSSININITKIIESCYANIINNIQETNSADEAAITEEAAEDMFQNEEQIKKIIVSLAIGIKYDSFKFDLKRICRINSKLSANIIYEYLTSIGKIGANAIPSIC
jgi:hypothetical protein